MRKLLVLTAALTLLLGGVVSRPIGAQSVVGSRPAPAFPVGLDWINTDEPVALGDLLGKVVILDFWTYGCINCIHVIPELQALEQKYPDELVVIGVHSAKFSNEADTANIRQVAERYGRTHPIVNDAGFEIWRQYSIRAWPSFIIIDPEGNVVGRHEGEGVYDLFDGLLTEMVATFEERGTLDRRELHFGGAGALAPATPLRYPTQLLADGAGGRLFIADTGHDRIVVTDFGGTVLSVVGSGQPGLVDGSFEDASFVGPQGMALGDDGLLYVADTGNHAIRAVDMVAGTVTTVAGTGEQEYLFGRDSTPASGGLNSPWDLLWFGGDLYVAMAGQHQVWKYVPGSGQLVLAAGNGREELRDGGALAAGLNQPTGLATDGETIYVADSEASAVRALSTEAPARLTTVVGKGLFDFGDVDGPAANALLQHPYDVAVNAGAVYVADTYNHKIRRIDVASGEVTTFAGDGEAGWADGAAARFSEPMGVSAALGALFVADTNNHAVRIVATDGDAVGVVSTLALKDPDGLLTANSAPASFLLETIELDPVTVPAPATPAGAPAASEGATAASESATAALTLSLPEGYIANDLAPLRVQWSSSGTAVTVQEPVEESVVEPTYPLELTASLGLSEGTDVLNVDVELYYCRETSAALCLIKQVRLRQPVEVVAGAEARGDDPAVLTLAYEPEPLPAGR